MSMPERSKNGSRRFGSLRARTSLCLVPLALFTLPSLTEQDGPVSESIAFVGVNVVPMVREEVLEDHTVIVTGDRIHMVGPSSEVEVPASATRVDGAGRYLMPGLADMHAHVWNEDAMVLFVANGVTTTRNMLGAPVHLEWRERIASDELFGPTLYTSGPIVDGNPAAASGGVSVSTPLEAADKVFEQVEAGYDFVKVYSRLDRECYDAILGAAEELDIPVAGHVPERVGVLHALESRQQTIEHLTAYQLPLQKDASPYRAPGSIQSLRDALLSWEHVETSRFSELVEPTAASGVWNCPTLVVTAAMTPDEDYEIQLARPEMRYLPKQVLDGWTREVRGVRSLSSDDRRRARATVPVRLELVGALNEKGCGLLLGTDCMNPFVVPGFSVHEELQLLVKAGLSPFEALAAGTSNAARALGREKEFGTIARGLRADLLLLDANPLEDVAHAAELAGVVLRGRWHSKQALDRRLEEVAQR